MSLLGLLGRGFGSTGGGGGGGSVSLGGVTLSVADQEDGTGATATVSAGAAGATNTVYISPWSGSLIQAAWTEAGERTGNGTIDLTLDEGLYWSVCLSVATDGSGTLSDLVGFRVSDGLDPIHYRICVAVKEKIQALSLPDIDAAKVKVLKLPWNVRNEIGTKGIVVSPVRETNKPADNHRDDIAWGVQVAFLRAVNEASGADAAMKHSLKNRQLVELAFSDKLLAGVDEVYETTVEPASVYVPPGFESQYDIGILLIRAKTQLYRGIY